MPRRELIGLLGTAAFEFSATRICPRLFKELVPGLTRPGMIAPVTGAVATREKDALRKAAVQFGFEFVHYGLATA